MDAQAQDTEATETDVARKREMSTYHLVSKTDDGQVVVQEYRYKQEFLEAVNALGADRIISAIHGKAVNLQPKLDIV